ncbi:hypothetical protein AWV79_37140 [Cupriavidus sp. UYMMa02A]|nr:hypothetical protein AWV79_37140 [Cupriavidus sp. UYMMa02A]
MIRQLFKWAPEYSKIRQHGSGRIICGECARKVFIQQVILTADGNVACLQILQNNAAILDDPHDPDLSLVALKHRPLTQSEAVHDVPPSVVEHEEQILLSRR